MPIQRIDTNTGGGRDTSLLSPSDYDADAASIRSDQDTDSDDDERQLRARNSRELRAHDRLVLMEEDELDQLVTETRRRQERGRRGSGLIPNPLSLFGRRGSDLSPSSPRLDPESSTEDLIAEKRSRRRSRRKAKRERLMSEAQHGEDGELMYEMEEGGMKEGSSTGESSDRDDSDERDRKGLLQLTDSRQGRARSWRRWVLIYSMIAVGFIILALVAWRLSLEKKRAPQRVIAPKLVSNGTAMFAPTTIIISLDGFRADFVNRGLTPRLSAFVKQGVSPRYMLPSFPSVTFPNHYTLATGLYPEAHGVVGNSFWDPELKEEFYYTDPSRSMHPKWWKGEPFWVTAQKQGLKTAIHMWPGSEAHILQVEPTYMDKYNGKEKLTNKVNSILGFLDMADEDRPQVIAAYVPNVDSDGHRFGPNSTEIRSTIRKVDDMLDSMFRGLEQRHLTDIVNVIIVSDHGMATTDITRLYQIEDLLDLSKIEHTDGWPLVGLRPKNPGELQSIYDGLIAKTKNDPNLEVYLRDVNMPERYHFSRNDRIAPLWIVPKTGWALVRMEEMNLKEAQAKKTVYHPRGLHGYDHEHPLMRAIFIARGPAFAHQPNSRVEPFQNIEVYNLLCDSVGIIPAPNNGTLRLPLKPVGLHEEPVGAPVDPPTHTLPTVPLTSTSAPTTTHQIQVDPMTRVSSNTTSPSKTLGVNPPQENKKQGSGDAESDGKEGSSVSSFWDWFTGKAKEWWGKVKGAVSGEMDGKKEPPS